MGIIEQVSSAYDARLYIKDHLSIENIPNECKESKLDEELKKFQSNRNSMMHQVQSFQLKQEAKKKKLFAELEEQLKKGKKVSKFL
jgi:shikimate kinase